MALLDIDKVIQELNQRFAAPLPEYYKRRIIFWHDEDHDFIDKINDVELENATVLVLNETNNFEIKKLLSYDDLTHNYCVYCPVSYDKEKDWLLPIKLYSEEFSADLISIWLIEMGMNNDVIIRQSVKDYYDFFNTKEHRNKVSNLKNVHFVRKEHIQLAVMAVLCNIKEVSPNCIVRTVLLNGINNDNNFIYQSFIKYKIDDAFWKMVGQATGYKDENPQLVDLISHILLTAVSQTVDIDQMIGLEHCISQSRQSYCYDFVAEWVNSEDIQSLYPLTRYVENELSLKERFKEYSIEELTDAEVFPCVDDCILNKLFDEISNQNINVDVINSVIEKRRTLLWYDQFKYYYEGLLEVSHMQQFYLNHAEGFHITEPKKIWHAYTSDYYKMDTYYRLFQVAFHQALDSSDSLLDTFKDVADVVERLYKNWFLNELGDNWSHAAKDELKNSGHIFGIPQQKSFYESCIQNESSRVFVIISDAMRYEVAVTLADELRQETQAEVKIDNREAIFPTITKFGMAALLPHKKLTVELKNNKLVVLADGQSTDMPNRKNILKAKNSKSTVLKYDELIHMKGKERLALVKGMSVVYIYHDRIDEVGHLDNPDIFDACDKTIRDLKNMVRIITKDFSGTRIYITADHGFMYTNEPLDEGSKADQSISSDDIIEVGRRYLIAKKGNHPDYLMPVELLDGKSFDGFAPIGNIHIKKQGGSTQFVHGGISLEEMVVPVINYHYMRKDSKAYQKNKEKYDTKPVGLNLSSAIRKINNLISSFEFYQTEPVSANRKKASYRLYFTDSKNKVISDIQYIIADKTSDNNKERTFKVKFNLKSQSYDPEETYYLVIENEDGKQVPKREKFTIDIAFAFEDYDFFS